MSKDSANKTTLAVNLRTFIDQLLPILDNDIIMIRVRKYSGLFIDLSCSVFSSDSSLGRLKTLHMFSVWK